ncbi:MAG: sensor histidine kinase KdpD [Rhizobacter sp.]|nr:sensor histidine kinase KdpD [Bacteriovorax sp.]
MNNEIDRPNPEDLLKAVNRLDSSVKKGKLKIFLGMCPGVGKTYAMLKTGLERANRGEKVYIGIVETHGRIETEIVSRPIPHVPRLTIEHKNTILEEMDLEGILKIKPSLVLVDELAHTNVPGQRHKKRYQDIEELLSNGIDVYTTVNIQHIESIKDSVLRITGVNVRENVPDFFFDLAEQIEIIDLSPEELLLRLKEGKVYLGDRADRAAENFFKIEHLIALRELALRFIAEKVDHDLQDQMVLKGLSGPWKTSEKLLVGISHSPFSERLIRATRRMSSMIDCPWYALYVQTGEILTDDDQKQLRANIELVQNLGGELLTSMDTDVLNAIRRTCNDKHITQIILGRPDKRLFMDVLLRGNILDRLVDSKSEVDIHVIRSERLPIYRGISERIMKRMPRLTTSFYSYYGAAWLILGISIIAYGLSPYLGYRSMGSLFLVAILFFSTFLTRGPLVFCAFLSAMIWNFFFIPPKFTLAIQTKEDIMMVVSYFIAAMVGGILTSRIRRQEVILERREKQTNSLYEFTKELSSKSDEGKIIKFLKGTLEDHFGSNIKILVSDNKEKVLVNSLQLNEKDYSVALWSYHHNKKAGWSTSTLSASDCISMPLSGESSVLGTVLFYPTDKNNVLNIEQEILLDSLMKQASLALERVIYGRQVQELKLTEVSKKLHETLLNSVSHEMRTPLTALIGSASALKEKAVLDNPETRELLTTEIVSSAKRLNRVVENLLDLSRLERADLALKHEWFTWEEFFHELKNVSNQELGTIKFNFEGNFEGLMDADYTLLLHAFYNLVSNTARYAGSRVEVGIDMDDLSSDNYFHIYFHDNGPGIQKEFKDQVFEKFFRLPNSKAGGLGLGLAIVKNIFELHDGTIELCDKFGGACFLISLPKKKIPASVKDLVDGK